MKIVSFSEATAQFDSLVELALQGEPTLIAKDSRRLLLQLIPSIPERPLGYFDEVYDKEYIRETNELAKHSGISVPYDLE